MSPTGRAFALCAAVAYLIAATAGMLAPPGFFIGPEGYAALAEQRAAHPWIHLFAYGGAFVGFAAVLGITLALLNEREVPSFDFGRWCEVVGLIACAVGMMHTLNQLYRIRFWSNLYLENSAAGQDGFYFAVLASQGADGGALSFLGVGLWMIATSILLAKRARIGRLAAMVGIVAGFAHIVLSVDFSFYVPIPYFVSQTAVVLLGASWFVLLARMPKA